MHYERIPRAARRMLLCASLLVFSLMTSAAAQTPPSPRTGPPPPPQPRGTRSSSSSMRIELPPPMPETPVPFLGGAPGSVQTLSFVTPDTTFDRNFVKGAPFTAEATTEHVQLLGDGNRMVRKSEARLVRDSQGRTRREHTLRRGGAVDANDNEPRLIVINDPIGQVNYMIETQAGIAHKRMLPPGLMEARRRAMAGDEASFGVLMPTSAAHRRKAEGDNAPAPNAPKKEQLEAQLIEGVLAEGTRLTVTIPAGEFDNEQPLEITHEQWYAPDLHIVVLMKHNDPRFGQTIFRLTNIMRDEPTADQFEVPAGYKIVDDSVRPRGVPMPVPMRPRPGNEP